MREFVAFRTLWNSVPLSEETTQLIFDCIDYYVKRSGKTMREVTLTMKGKNT